MTRYNVMMLFFLSSLCCQWQRKCHRPGQGLFKNNNIQVILWYTKVGSLKTCSAQCVTFRQHLLYCSHINCSIRLFSQAQAISGHHSMIYNDQALSTGALCVCVCVCVCTVRDKRNKDIVIGKEVSYHHFNGIHHVCVTRYIFLHFHVWRLPLSVSRHWPPLYIWHKKSWMQEYNYHFGWFFYYYYSLIIFLRSTSQTFCLFLFEHDCFESHSMSLFRMLFVQLARVNSLMRELMLFWGIYIQCVRVHQSPVDISGNQKFRSFFFSTLKTTLCVTPSLMQEAPPCNILSDNTNTLAAHPQVIYNASSCCVCRFTILFFITFCLFK